MKKIMAAILAMTLLLTCSALAEQIYEATAQGYMGYVTVHVKTDGSSIIAVDVVNCTDVPEELSGAAVAQVPADIVKYQTVNVDTVSGATFTSRAIITAVKDALSQAGMTMDAEPVKESAVLEDTNVDVLVIGGGGAGMTAAIAAKDPELTGGDNGLSVMLVEKNGMLGGSTMLAGGSMGVALPMNSTELVDNDEMWAAHAGFAEFYSGAINEDAMRAMMRVSGDTLLKMQSLGLSVITAGSKEDASAYSDLLGWVQAYVNTGDAWQHAGTAIGDFLMDRLDASSVDVRLGSRAVKLVTDNGEVTGAVIETADGSYTVFAKKVILAAGGLGQNRTLLEQYLPGNSAALPFMTAGATGDGIKMATDLGATVGGDGVLGYIGSEIRHGSWSDMANLYNGSYSVIMVNSNGERFCPDGAGYGWLPKDTYQAILEQEGTKAYIIIDSAHPGVALAQNTALTNCVWSADTLEELAESIGVPVDNLTATVNTYNETLASGADDAAFGVANGSMVACENGPYYAVIVRPVLMGTFAGLNVTENFEVLGADGIVIPNLYAAGENAFHGGMYLLSGALYSGRIAASSAAAEILGE